MRIFTPHVTLKNYRSLIRMVQSIFLQSFIDVLEMCYKSILGGTLRGPPLLYTPLAALKNRVSVVPPMMPTYSNTQTFLTPDVLQIFASSWTIPSKFGHKQTNGPEVMSHNRIVLEKLNVGP